VTARRAVRAAARPYVLATSVFVAAAVCYAATLAPTVTFVDSGELIAAAKSLGVAHPPGFPLYTLVAHVSTWLPFGTLAERVHLVSAVFAAVAAATLALLVLEILRRQAPGSGRPDSVWAGAAALSGGLLFAFSRALWSYATVAEVYSLSIALVLAAVLLVVRWSTRGGDRLLYAGATLFGLALGVHHVTVALTLPALLWLVLRARGARFLASRTVLMTALIALGAAALVYASMPLAASREAGLNWGDPQTLERFWWHVTGRQYQAFFDLSFSQIGHSLASEVRFVLHQLGPPWFPLALAAAAAGAVRLFLRDRTIFWFLILVVVPNLGYALVYAISEDKDAYLLPTYAAFALAAAVGMDTLRRARALPKRAAVTATAALLVLLPTVSFAASLPFENRHHFFAAEDYADGILSTVGRDGLLLTYDWEVYSPLLYVQEVEGRRPDVAVIDGNLLRRSWYFDYLKRTYPELLRQAREPVRLYLDDLRHWERDHALYERPDLNRRITARFQAVIASFVEVAIDSGPVYATPDIAGQTDAVEVLSRRYNFVPQGLVLQLYGDRGFHDPAAPPLRLRGVTDRSVRLERDDVVREQVLPAMLRMLTLRAGYLQFFGRPERARAAFAEAERFRRRFGL
jgi:Protein O-mannosyl-transferase TMEM260-like